MASTVIMAGLGFLFWVLVARFYSPGQVGLATSLISATSMIAYLSLFGLNSTLIRFPAPDFARNAQISQSIAVVGVIACAAAGLYLLGVPWYAPRLLFVRDHVLLALGFVLFCLCAALNQLTDAVFIGFRQPEFNVLIDGAVQGLTKLALPVSLAGFGAAGIVGASGSGFAAAVAAALLLMRRRLGFRFDFRTRGTRLLKEFGYSVSSYVSSLLNLAPLMVVPLIVLADLGAEQTGYYFMAFQISSLLTALSYSVGQALFAEASYDESRFTFLLKRSAAIIAGTQIPAAAVVAAGSRLLLGMFGGQYADRAAPLLTVLACGSVAVGLNAWASFALKIAKSMTHLIMSNVVYSVVTIGLAALWAPRGLVWLGWAWGAGNLASGLYAGAALLTVRSARRAAAAAPPRLTAWTAPVLPAEDHCR